MTNKPVDVGKKPENLMNSGSNGSENSVWMIVSVVLALLLFVSLFFNPFRPSGMVTAVSVGDENFDEQALAEKTVAFLNDNFLTANNVESKVNSVSELAEGLYEIRVDIYDNGEVAETVPVVVSADGTKMLLGQVVDMTRPLPKPSQQESEPKQIPKLEKSKLEAFVMSFCPFGIQAMSAIAPVAKLLGDKAVIEPHFIHYSNYCANNRCDPKDYCLNGESQYCGMHGIGEVHENLRQMAMFRIDSSKYWDYVLDLIPRIKSGEVTTKNVDEEWKKSAEAVGLDVNAVEAWIDENAETVLMEEMQLAQSYNATGSPTVIVNGVRYNGQRTPEAYKSAVCSGFSSEPEECNSTLSSEGASAAGSCN